jgi:23S rRNA (uracil1939-C5)-methyltransferase
VATVAGWIPPGAHVAEFYAGCGALGLGLLRGSAQVRFNELSAHGLQGLALGVAARPAGEHRRARIEAGPAAGCLGLLSDASAVIVDPPRKGLDAELLAALAAAPPERLVYVSCDRTSFARDSRQLLADGRMRLTELVAYALFPNTHHVELAARFET